jgi:hypothetical protein
MVSEAEDMEMYTKSHNSNGALLNTKVVPFKVLKGSIQFLTHLLFKVLIRPLDWSGSKHYYKM